MLATSSCLAVGVNFDMVGVMKKSIIALIALGVLVLILAILGPGIYSANSTVKNCYAFASKPEAAIKACGDILQEDQRHQRLTGKLDINDAYTVLWLHIAHAHLGHNDQQEFEHNSTIYLNGEWPAPLLSFFLGKTSIEDVFAKAKTGDQNTQNDNICDANFYLGEWYLENKIRDKALAAFQAAHSICKPKEVTAGFVDTELKALQP